MAHKLANGNYRHKGETITRRVVPSSTGWGVEWRHRGKEYDTLALALRAVDRFLEKRST
jgi:hypothetical protein